MRGDARLPGLCAESTLEVAPQHPQAFGKRRLREELAGAEQMIRAAENPRIIKRAAADAHAGAAGLVEHMFRGLGCGDIAVADDGNFFDGFDDGTDAREIDAAGESLGAGAAVDENRGDTDVFEDAGEMFWARD